MIHRTLAFACFACLALGAGPLAAQQPVGGGASALRSGQYLDYFVHWQRDAENGGAVANGVGGRIMWQLPRAGFTPLSPLARAALGAYLIRLSPDDDWEDVWHFGVHADVPLVRTPLAERVEPVVSLGIGAIRVPSEHGQAGAAAAIPTPTEVRTGMEHALTLTPGIGARIRIVPGVHLRSDVRQVLHFRESTQRYLEASGGLSFQV